MTSLSGRERKSDIAHSMNKFECAKAIEPGMQVFFTNLRIFEHFSAVSMAENAPMLSEVLSRWGLCLIFMHWDEKNWEDSLVIVFYHI